MRLLACTTLTIATLLVAAPARAQTYDPSYPVCLQTYGIDGGYIDCSFTSLAQCSGVCVGPLGAMPDKPVFRAWCAETAAAGAAFTRNRPGTLIEASSPFCSCRIFHLIIRQTISSREVM